MVAVRIANKKGSYYDAFVEYAQSIVYQRFTATGIAPDFHWIPFSPRPQKVKTPKTIAILQKISPPATLRR